MFGFSLKFWTMAPGEGEGEDAFQIQALNSFIFQDETHENLVTVSNVIMKIAGSNPDLEKCVNNMVQMISPGHEADDLSNTINPSDFVNIKHEVKTNEPAIVKMEPLNNDDNEDDNDEKWMDVDFQLIDKKKKAEKEKKALSTTSSNALYKCESCLKTFSWVKNFATHLNDCNPPQLEDEFANLKPGVQKKLRKYLSMTPEERNNIKKEKIEKAKVKYPKGPFFCEKCPQVFQKYPGFVSHVNAHNLSAKNNPKADPELPPKVQYEYQLDDLRDGLVMRCDKCDLAYSAFQSYKNHMDQFHKKAITCEHCGMKFTLRNTLVKHKVDYHTLYPRKCDQCPTTLLTAKDFFEHLQKHGKDYIGRTAPCEICGKMLKNKYVLKAHVEAVHEKKTKSGQFSCDECGKILGTKASLEYHRKSAHLNEFPYRCEVCGKGFLKYNRMMTCLNNHHGIYKYRCTECDYKTNKLLQFKEHMNSHTRSVIYYCPVCNQQSNGTKNLGCHTKQVHKLTLCQAEILHKRSRLGEPMTEEQIEEMKHKMTSLKPYHMPMPIKRFENGVPVVEEKSE